MTTSSYLRRCKHKKKTKLISYKFIYEFIWWNVIMNCYFNSNTVEATETLSVNVMVLVIRGIWEQSPHPDRDRRGYGANQKHNNSWNCQHAKLTIFLVQDFWDISWMLCYHKAYNRYIPKDGKKFAINALIWIFHYAQGLRERLPTTAFLIRSVLQSVLHRITL